jgi:hypothetical protein
MQEPPSIWQRLFLLIPALLLAHGFIVLPAEDGWTSYWLLRDGKRGKAVITEVLWTGHDGVAYRYRVNGKEYAGKGGRNHEDPRYRVYGAQVGEESIVYYSASHPWLSQLQRPRTVVEGLPVVILAWVILGLMLVTIVNPRHRWALQLGQSEAKPTGKV